VENFLLPSPGFAGEGMGVRVEAGVAQIVLTAIKGEGRSSYTPLPLLERGRG
jgi:hypothetical protein